MNAVSFRAGCIGKFTGIAERCGAAHLADFEVPFWIDATDGGTLGAQKIRPRYRRRFRKLTANGLSVARSYGEQAAKSTVVNRIGRSDYWLLAISLRLPDGRSSKLGLTVGRSDTSIGCSIMTSSATTKPKMTVKKSKVNAVM
jgi:hypothetical protein